MKALAGEVIASYGRQYEVLTTDDRKLLCTTRSKQRGVACGERVTVTVSSENQGVITEILPRTSIFYRSDAFREKLLAANVSQVVIVVATEPGFSDTLLNRCLVAASQQNIRALIVLNKTDITDQLPAAQAQLAPYKALGYPCVELSAKSDASALLPYLIGQQSLLVGQSGMGKSTIINTLVPEARARTREISTVLDSGKHTTTHTRLYRLNNDPASTIIDSPGVQAFGLAHLSVAELEEGFVEFKDHLDHCRFRNCQHNKEPGCAIQAAVVSGDIAPARLAAYHVLRNELEHVVEQRQDY